MTHQLCAKKQIGLAKIFTLKTLKFLHNTWAENDRKDNALYVLFCLTVYICMCTV